MKMWKIKGRFPTSELDHIALAEAGTRDDFIELEFLVNRGLSELNGIKNIISLARRLV